MSNRLSSANFSLSKKPMIVVVKVKAADHAEFMSI
jgi:hypothetical protein